MASEVDGWIGEPTRIKHRAVIGQKQKKIKENVKKKPKQCDRIKKEKKKYRVSLGSKIPDDVTLFSDMMKKNNKLLKFEFKKISS